MSLAPGTRIGPYAISALLGAGGMGEVYRATDSRLKRPVALKVLPAGVAADPERLMRFQREAELLAALNHPNIAAIHGVEDSAGMRALVMELVEGPTLADRIAHGAIPLAEALAIAKQIAKALEAAHEHGIVHRDLKPANIKVRPDGTVKVLDFGVAKAIEPVGVATGSLSLESTVTSPALGTGTGVIIGTAAYMSPEQARGSAVDRRTDIWAFGVVLYEMLTGTRLFAAASVSDTLAQVLTREPNWTTLPKDTPASVRRLLRRCLERDRRRRLESAADARLEIEDAMVPVDGEQQGSGDIGRGRNGALIIGLSAAILIAGALSIPAVRHFREVAPPRAFETRLEVSTPTTSAPMSFALSPDGRSIVFVATGEGESRLWVRTLASTTAEPLSGTEGASYPFWAPNGRSIAFFADGQLKRLDLDGGAPQTLTSAVGGRGGSWSSSGIILFTETQQAPLSRIAATGGSATRVTTLVSGQAGHRFPVFLPDGVHFLFYAQGAGDAGGIYLGALEGSEPSRLTAGDSAATYLPNGWLVWARGGTLVGQRLDVDRRALVGAVVPIADSISVEVDGNLAALSASAAGTLAYRAGGTLRQLTWFNRSGRVLGTFDSPNDSTQLNSPLTLSPDNRRVAVTRTVQGNMDVWVLDGVRANRFTFDSNPDRNPVWSPDGSRLAFTSNRPAPRNLYMKAVSGAGAETMLFASPQNKNSLDWSPDGRFMLFQSTDSETAFDLWVLPVQEPDGRRNTPWTFLRTPFNETSARFSPDGRWVAYASDESGRLEVYVRAFSPPAGAAGQPPEAQWQISTVGGASPSWRADGRELYYIAPTGDMMAVPVERRGNAIEAGAPVSLFRTPVGTYGLRQYDVARDGRFLINVALDDPGGSPITLLQNWTPAVPE